MGLTTNTQWSGTLTGPGQGIKVEAISTEQGPEFAPNNNAGAGTAGDLDTRIEIETTYVNVTVSPVIDVPTFSATGTTVNENDGSIETTDPDLIVPLGANIGLAPRWFVRFNPARHIVCGEPLPENIEIIRRNCPQAQIVAAAIGDASGTVDLLTDADGVIASSIPTAWNSARRTFPVRTLDDCAAEYGWGDVAVLKMDAEGMEPAILRGARQVLTRTACVAAETHGRAGHDEVQALLRDAGFQITEQRFGTHTGMVFAERSV